ncbi:MAG: chemotaxis protein CheX [Thermoguttaceae bacterium]
MLDVDYLNPVVASLEETFKTMLNLDVERSGLELMANNVALHPVSGIIGVSGKGVGTIVLSLSNNVAIKAASTMLMMDDITEVTDDVLDAVGELTNMISGGAKARLAAFSLTMSLPNVLCGDNCRLHFPSNAHPIAIPFKCDWGLLGLQVGFSLR